MHIRSLFGEHWCMTIGTGPGGDCCIVEPGIRQRKRPGTSTFCHFSSGMTGSSTAVNVRRIGGTRKMPATMTATTRNKPTPALT